MAPKRPTLSLDDYEAGVCSGDRATLARAITLMESSRPEDQVLAADLLTRLMPHTGAALRVGITGVPGAGKSTFIETLGTNLAASSSKVAVLAVDPSSVRSGGSILGDKTRMEALSSHPSAFIRPSPASGTLGGVASKTREAMLCCEAAGYDVVLVETIGVGQSELVVSEMTDFFIVLMLAGAGDELQGIKRGLMELAEMLVFNKADGDMEPIANRAAHTYRNALKYMHPTDALWHPPVLTCSALHNRGIEEVWKKVQEYRTHMTQAGALQKKRRQQRVRWLWSMVDEQLRYQVKHHPTIKEQVTSIEGAVEQNDLAPTTAARQIIDAFQSRPVNS